MNENASDSLSSGSDSGFYHTGSGHSGGSRDHNDGGATASASSVKSSSVAGQSSPRYSTCSSRCSSSEFDSTATPTTKMSKATVTEAAAQSALKRTNRSLPLRSCPSSASLTYFFSPSPFAGEDRRPIRARASSGATAGLRPSTGGRSSRSTSRTAASTRRT